MVFLADEIVGHAAWGVRRGAYGVGIRCRLWGVRREASKRVENGHRPLARRGRRPQGVKATFPPIVAELNAPIGFCLRQPDRNFPCQTLKIRNVSLVVMGS